MLKNILFKKKILLMKLSDEQKETYNWLESHGFDYYDIDIIIKLYKKEEIKFCIKSFDVNDFPDLRRYLDEQHNSSYIDYLLKDVMGVDKNKVKRMLYHR
jgi:hypothetical protein